MFYKRTPQEKRTFFTVSPFSRVSADPNPPVSNKQRRWNGSGPFQTLWVLLYTWLYTWCARKGGDMFKRGAYLQKCWVWLSFCHLGTLRLRFFGIIRWCTCQMKIPTDPWNIPLATQNAKKIWKDFGRKPVAICSSGPLHHLLGKNCSKIIWDQTTTQVKTNKLSRLPWGAERSCMMHTSSWPIFMGIWENGAWEARPHQKLASFRWRLRWSWTTIFSMPPWIFMWKVPGCYLVTSW